MVSGNWGGKMKQRVSVKVFDNMGLDERTQKILNTAVMNFAVMTSALLVKSKGRGGEGIALNPVEDCFCGVMMIYQQPIDEELAEEFKEGLERRLDTFFKMSEIDMTAEIEVL
jgi:hypothetical protein